MTHVRKVMNRVCHAPSLRRQQLASNCWQGARETLALFESMVLPYVSHLASAPLPVSRAACRYGGGALGGGGQGREYLGK